LSTDNDTINDIRAGKFIPIAEVEITDTGATFYPLDPNLYFNILVVKGANPTIISTTTTPKKDIEQGVFIVRSTGTTNFFKGDSLGITGIKVDVTFVSGKVDVIINSYRFLN